MSENTVVGKVGGAIGKGISSVIHDPIGSAAQLYAAPAAGLAGVVAPRAGVAAARAAAQNGLPTLTPPPAPTDGQLTDATEMASIAEARRRGRSSNLLIGGQSLLPASGLSAGRELLGS